MRSVHHLGYGSAHGKIILSGEHAVVHGYPAVAIPFTSVEIEAFVSTSDNLTATIDSAYFTGSLDQAPEMMDHLTSMIDYFFAQENLEKEPLQIKISSTIPIERGMGSSAAVATALSNALIRFYDLSDENLEKYVEHSEKMAHGNPSGIDALVIRTNQAVKFQKNKIPESFGLHLPGFLIIGDTGLKGSTSEAVRAVGDALKTDPQKTHKTLEKIGQITENIYQSIEEEDISEMGEWMTQNHKLLKLLGVSHDSLDQLVRTALETGALGAKMTGGGRGGCMIALADQLDLAKKIEKALLDRGAEKTWIMPLGGF